MAGDLFIQNITFNQVKMLTDAGGTQTKTIFHSDRSWSADQHVLTAQLAPTAANNRTHLPPHAYVTFSSANRAAIRTFVQSSTNPLRFKDFFATVSRPLGVVANNPNLAQWNAVNANRVAIFLDALDHGNVTLEYYLFDNGQLMTIWGKDTSWTKAPE